MDHEWMKEKLFELYDGQLPPESRDVVQSHVDHCAECQILRDEWKQTKGEIIEPLRVANSELFVQNVMRQVRGIALREAKAGWAVFSRWAFPALGLAMTSFALACVLTLRPVSVSTDALLLGDEPPVSTAWLSYSMNEDPMLDSTVANP